MYLRDDQITFLPLAPRTRRPRFRPLLWRPPKSAPNLSSHAASEHTNASSCLRAMPRHPLELETPDKRDRASGSTCERLVHATT
jgi:hypothetical protein